VQTTSTRSWRRRRPWQWAALCATLLLVLVVSGCVRPTRSVVVSRSAPHATGAAETRRADASFATIVDELQRGHYAEGEQALRQYLAKHPGDRAAQAMLRQLTGDPQQLLGRASRAHVVQEGESYSLLAARHLGDAIRFLILARYNGSTNPSRLQVGQTVQLPVSGAGVPAEAQPVVAGTGEAGHGAMGEPSAPANADARRPVAAVAESSAQKARRLQKESVALLGQGQRQQALARLDEALTIDPRLPPGGTAAASLRKDLLAGCHQRAIVLYRNQQLDPAIALWDHVLAIDPGYEPATVYRARALELKQRLKQF
jgi:tetratricopeptide (TPR) repeat protein